MSINLREFFLLGQTLDLLSSYFMSKSLEIDVQIVFIQICFLKRNWDEIILKFTKNVSKSGKNYHNLKIKLKYDLTLKSFTVKQNIGRW